MGLVRSFTQTQQTRLPNSAIPSNPSLGTSPTLVGVDRSLLKNRCAFTIFNSGSLPVMIGHGATAAAPTSMVARLEPGDFYYEEPSAPFQGAISLATIGGTTSVNAEDLIII